MKNLILTGFMGTGKSSVGRLLATRLGRPFVDTDEWIVQQAGKPVAAIFAQESETAFRKLETAAARKLSRQRGLIIATGGRLMLDPENAENLQRTGDVICLAASPGEIVGRLQKDGVARPLLAGADPAGQAAALLAERQAGYARFPQVSTSGKTIAQVATEIIEQWGLEPAASSKSDPAYLPVMHPTGQYNVVVGAGLLHRLRELAPVEDRPLFVLSDSHVGPLYAPLLPEAETVITFPAGEGQKTLATAAALYEKLLAAGLDRRGVIVALGGGVTGDVAGFVAATYMRGVALVQCPTSLLAMVDASVGGKTGVDLPQGKNLVGAFKQPLAVLADVSTLRTLPPAEWAAGMAEVVKHGLLAAPGLLSYLEEETIESLFHASLPDLQVLVARAIEVKRNVVEEDPFEQGRRALLNLGHTFAHAIEQVSQYEVRHGEAVAAGLVASAHLSARLGLCDAALQERLETLLLRLSLPVRIPAKLLPSALLQAMQSDKKRARGQLHFILMRDVGDVFATPDVPESAVMKTLTALRE